MNTYFALVHKDSDSAFGVTFPDLPGCFSAADDEADIFQEAQTALALYAQDASRLPDARSVAELQRDAAIRSELAAGAFLIAIPLIVAEKKCRYNIMLDPALVQGIDATAETLGVSRSHFIAQSVADRLARDAHVAIVRPKRQGGMQTVIKASASSASKVRRDPKASKAAKTAAASALTKRPGKKK